jgi:heat shock protein HslJ
MVPAGAVDRIEGELCASRECRSLPDAAPSEDTTMKASRTKALPRATLAVFVGLAANTAISQSIQGMSQTSASPALAGTSWQLVRFQGSDDKTLTPDDRSKYTIKFAAGGQLTARIDCNRGRGTWKSSGPNQLQFGPLALTRALCPAGSLHDQIVKQWDYIRSYMIKDSHLFLSLMADGGIYEFEPVTKTKPQPG